jgi:hypothetical protein
MPLRRDAVWREVRPIEPGPSMQSWLSVATNMSFLDTGRGHVGVYRRMAFPPAKNYTKHFFCATYLA